MKINSWNILTKENVPSENVPPFSIVWTNLPLITQIIPCIGHTGITELIN